MDDNTETKRHWNVRKKKRPRVMLYDNEWEQLRRHEEAKKVLRVILKTFRGSVVTEFEDLRNEKQIKKEQQGKQTSMF